jgi:hypothetical protein
LVCSIALAQVQQELAEIVATPQEFHFMVTERGPDTPRSADYATITSAALAAHRTHHRHAIHFPAMKAFAGVGASPVVCTGFY